MRYDKESSQDTSQGNSTIQELRLEDYLIPPPDLRQTAGSTRRVSLERDEAPLLPSKTKGYSHSPEVISPSQESTNSDHGEAPLEEEVQQRSSGKDTTHLTPTESTLEEMNPVPTPTRKAPPPQVQLKLDLQKKPTPQFYRVTKNKGHKQFTDGVAHLQPLTTEDFASVITSPRLTAAMKILEKLPSYGDSFKKRTLSAELAYGVIHCTFQRWSSGNEYAHSDKDGSGVEDKKAIMRLFMRLTVTPASTCPNFDSKTSSIYNPTLMETLYYATHLLFGAVADQEVTANLSKEAANEDQNSTSKAGKKSQQGTTNKGKPPRKPRSNKTKQGKKTAKTNRGSNTIIAQAKPKPVENPYTTKKTSRSKELERDFTTYIYCTFSPTTPFEKSDDAAKHAIAVKTLVPLIKTLFEVDPEAVIHRNEASRFSTFTQPLTEDMENQFPRNSWDCSNYARDFFVSNNGWSPRATLKVSHNIPIQDLIGRINVPDNAEESGRFLLEVHEIQAALLSSPCWLLASHGDMDRQALKTAIQEQQPFQNLLSTCPDLQVQVKWELVRKFSREPIPTDQKVFALHIWTQKKHHHQLARCLEQIYSSTKKTGFPLNTKLVCVPNTASPESLASFRSKQVAATARLRQKAFLMSIAKYELVNVIEDMDRPMYGGGPNLADHLIGMQHPSQNHPLILGINKDGRREGVHIITYFKSNEEYVMDAVKKLGMIFLVRYDQSGLTPFTQDFREQQLASYKFVQGRWVSTEDLHLAKVNRTAKTWFQEQYNYDEQDEDDEESMEEQVDAIENMQFLLPGAHRTKSIIHLDEASATTIQGFKADAMTDMNSLVGDASFGFSESQPEFPLRFPSLESIPGFPPLPVLEASGTEATKPKTVDQLEEGLRLWLYDRTSGAHIIDSDFRLAEFSRGNLPQMSDEFNTKWSSWLDGQNSKGRTHQLPEFKIRRNMWGMFVRERATVEDFFARYNNLPYATIVELHTVRRLWQDYPSPSRLGLEETDVFFPLVVIPSYKPGTHRRRLIRRIFHSRANWTQWDSLRINFDTVYLLALAFYDAFPIDKEECQLHEYAATFAETATTEQIIACQLVYNSILQQATSTFQETHGPDQDYHEIFYPDSDQEEDEDEMDLEEQTPLSASETVSSDKQGGDAQQPPRAVRWKDTEETQEQADPEEEEDEMELDSEAMSALKQRVQEAGRSSSDEESEDQTMQEDTTKEGTKEQEVKASIAKLTIWEKKCQERGTIPCAYKPTIIESVTLPPIAFVDAIDLETRHRATHNIKLPEGTNDPTFTASFERWYQTSGYRAPGPKGEVQCNMLFVAYRYIKRSPQFKTVDAPPVMKAFFQWIEHHSFHEAMTMYYLAVPLSRIDSRLTGDTVMVPPPNWDEISWQEVASKLDPSRDKFHLPPTYRTAAEYLYWWYSYDDDTGTYPLQGGMQWYEEGDVSDLLTMLKGLPERFQELGLRAPFPL